jgi:anti-sigma regulatory factor (Ser/Thr protein kinase)
MQLVLALDEVVTNVITHGGLASGNAVTVTVDVQGNAILAAVEDPGPPFDPLSEAPPAPLTGSLQERPIGGLGLHIVRSIMQSLAYERADDRNRLVMRLDL